MKKLFCSLIPVLASSLIVTSGYGMKSYRRRTEKLPLPSEIKSKHETANTGKLKFFFDCYSALTEKLQKKLKTKETNAFNAGEYARILGKKSYRRAMNLKMSTAGEFLLAQDYIDIRDYRQVWPVSFQAFNRYTLSGQLNRSKHTDKMQKYADEIKKYIIDQEELEALEKNIKSLITAYQKTTEDEKKEKLEKEIIKDLNTWNRNVISQDNFFHNRPTYLDFFPLLTEENQPAKPTKPKPPMTKKQDMKKWFSRKLTSSEQKKFTSLEINSWRALLKVNEASEKKATFMNEHGAYTTYTTDTKDKPQKIKWITESLYTAETNIKTTVIKEQSLEYWFKSLNPKEQRQFKKIEIEAYETVQKAIEELKKRDWFIQTHKGNNSESQKIIKQLQNIPWLPKQTRELTDQEITDDLYDSDSD